MPRVIKQTRVVRSDDVVLIPDSSPPVPEAVWDSEAPEQETDFLPEPGEVPLREEDAGETAERILRSAGAEREKILEQARREADEIRQLAQQAGYEDAYREIQGELTLCMSQIQELLDEMQDRQQQYFWIYKRELKYLAVDIAEKILHRTIEEQDDAMEDLIRHTVLSIKNVDWVTADVSDQLVALVQRMNQEFATGDSRVAAELAAKSVPRDSLVVRTPEGVVDASVPVQLQNLRELFTKLEDEYS